MICLIQKHLFMPTFIWWRFCCCLCLLSHSKRHLFNTTSSSMLMTLYFAGTSVYLMSSQFQPFTPQINILFFLKFHSFVIFCNTFQMVFLAFLAFISRFVRCYISMAPRKHPFLFFFTIRLVQHRVCTFHRCLLSAFLSVIRINTACSYNYFVTCSAPMSPSSDCLFHLWLLFALITIGHQCFSRILLKVVDSNTLNLVGIYISTLSKSLPRWVMASFVHAPFRHPTHNLHWPSDL